MLSVFLKNLKRDTSEIQRPYKTTTTTTTKKKKKKKKKKTKKKNDGISITLALGQNGFFAVWLRIWLQIKLIFIGKWIKGCLTFPDFSCLTLGHNKLLFNRDTHHRVRLIPRLLKNNRMSPRHFSFHYSVVLREITGHEYERITNIVFYEFIIRVMHTYYRCEKFVRVIHRSEGFAGISHNCEKFTRILHRCDKYVRMFRTCDIFVWLWHSNESVLRMKKSHIFVTHVNHSNEFFTGVTNTCEFFTRLKLDICEKSYLLNIKIGRTYTSHIPMWPIRANNSQRVKNTKCEY